MTNKLFKPNSEKFVSTFILCKKSIVWIFALIFWIPKARKEIRNHPQWINFKNYLDSNETSKVCDLWTWIYQLFKFLQMLEESFIEFALIYEKHVLRIFRYMYLLLILLIICRYSFHHINFSFKNAIII